MEGLSLTSCVKPWSSDFLLCILAILAVASSFANAEIHYREFVVCALVSHFSPFLFSRLSFPYFLFLLEVLIFYLKLLAYGTGC